MENKAAHWNSIFNEKSCSELGWYEQNSSQTLKFFSTLDLSGKTVFIPGAGTSNLVEQLEQRGCFLVLNDISQKALNKLKERVGTANKTFLCADVSQPFSKDISVDLWIDRAVLHFLLSEQEINQYFDHLKSCVKLGGFVLLAQFSTSGAKKCAGLDLHQYSQGELVQRLGEHFELISCENYLFKTPTNLERPYIYAFFKRIKE